MIKLTANSLTYTVEDEGGYCFTVDAVHDPEWGWTASVTMSVSGIKHAEDAVKYLAHPAEHFVRALRDEESETPGSEKP